MLTLKTGIKGQAQVKVVEENTAENNEKWSLVQFLQLQRWWR